MVHEPPAPRERQLETTIAALSDALHDHQERQAASRRQVEDLQEVLRRLHRMLNDPRATRRQLREIIEQALRPQTRE